MDEDFSVCLTTELSRIKKERDDYKMWAIKLNNLLRREGWSQGEIDGAAFPDEEGSRMINESLRLFTVRTYYADAGILVAPNDVVVKTAPIYSWMIGKSLSTVARWQNCRQLIEHPSADSDDGDTL